ncbi:hypothetical protein FBY31_0360 [Arthrobacter sp. SLBN-100]|uniref:SRPBCC family protein n=1 Tax=Arthrobacter sp. SLBN-100 TaxID=2768450 RepID=UPI001153F150|nr:SRPBCC family protein [Arthrobacter sp. SLBN-100]TQJ66352.1 hypothetical protein FBY31_0360 [Arthrobacter sp. SLBN-100]
MDNPGLSPQLLPRIFRIVGAILAAVDAYHRFLRPLHLQWGASKEEAERSMPGDELVDAAYITTTRAVSIKAGPGDIWPWLVQMGDRRGGLYSYDFLDRAFGILSGPSADRILPEFQRLAAGDVIPLGKGPDWPVAVLDPERAMVLEPVSGRVSWCFALYPNGDLTRLVSRVRIRIYTRPVLWILAPLVDACWFIMERKMLKGIRQRAEKLDSVASPWEPGMQKEDQSL